jgi:hypothetical protein
MTSAGVFDNAVGSSIQIVALIQNHLMYHLPIGIREPGIAGSCSKRFKHVAYPGDLAYKVETGCTDTDTVE